MDDLVFICVSCGKGLSDYEEFCSHVASHDSGTELQETPASEPVTDSIQAHTEDQSPNSNTVQSVNENGKEGRDGDENVKCAAVTKTFDIRDVEQTCNEILEVAAARKGEHVTAGCANADFITQSERQTLQEASKLILISKLQSEAKLHRSRDRVSRPVLSNGTADVPRSSNREKGVPRYTHRIINSVGKVGMESDMIYGYKSEPSAALNSNRKYGNVLDVFPKQRPVLNSNHYREYPAKEEGSLMATKTGGSLKSETLPDWSVSRYWTKGYKEGHGTTDKDRSWAHERGHSDGTFLGYHSPPGHVVPIHIPVHQPRAEVQVGKPSMMVAPEMHDAKGCKAMSHKMHSPCSRSSSVTVPLCRSPKSLPFISDVRSLSHISGDQYEEKPQSVSPKPDAVRSSLKVDRTQTSEQSRPFIVLEKNQVFEDQPAKIDLHCRKPGILDKGICHRDNHLDISEHHPADMLDHYHVTSYVLPRHHAVRASSKHTHSDYSKPEVRMSHTYGYYPLQPGHVPPHGIPHHVPHYRFNPHYKGGQISASHYSPVVHIGDITDSSRGHETGSEIPNLAAAKSRESCNCAQCFRRTHHRGSTHYLHSPTSAPIQELKKMTQNEATQTSTSVCECDGKVCSLGPNERGDGKCCKNGKTCNVRRTCTHEPVGSHICPTTTSPRHPGRDHRPEEDREVTKTVKELFAHGKTSCNDRNETLPLSYKVCKVEVDDDSRSCTTATNGDTDSQKRVLDTPLSYTHSRTELNTNQTQHVKEKQTAAQITPEDRNGSMDVRTQIGPVTVKSEPLEYSGEETESRLQPLSSEQSDEVLKSVKKEGDVRKCEDHLVNASPDLKEDGNVDCGAPQASVQSDVSRPGPEIDECHDGRPESMEADGDLPECSEPEHVETSAISTVNSSEAVAEVEAESAKAEVESRNYSSDDVLVLSQDSTSDSCGSNWETLLCNEGTVPLSPSRTRPFVSNCSASVTSVYVDNQGRQHCDSQMGWKDLSQEATLKQSAGLLRIFKMKDADISATNEKVASPNTVYLSGICSTEEQHQVPVRTVFRDNNQNEVVVMSVKPGVRGENVGYNNAGFISLTSLEFPEAQKSKVVEEVLLKQGKFVKGRTYECDICSQSYASYDEMFVHRRTHRQKTQDTQTPTTKKVPRVLCPRYIMCKFCDKTFQTSSDYGNHVAFECPRVSRKPSEEGVSEISCTQARSNLLVSSSNESSNPTKPSVSSNTCMREMRISVAGEEKLVSVVHPLLPSIPVTGVAKDSVTHSAKGPVGGGAKVVGRHHGLLKSTTSETSEHGTRNSKDREDVSHSRDILETNPLPSIDKTSQVVVSSISEQVPQSTDLQVAPGTKVALQPMLSAPPLTNLVVGNNVIQGQLIVTSTGTYLLPTQNVVFPQKNVSGKAPAVYRPLLPKSINEDTVENASGSVNVNSLPVAKEVSQISEQQKTLDGSSGRKRASKRKHSGDGEFFGPISTDATTCKRSTQGELTCSRCQIKFLNSNSYQSHMDRCGNNSRYNFRGRKTSYREFYESDESVSDD